MTETTTPAPHTGPSLSLIEQIDKNLVESGLDIAACDDAWLEDEVAAQLAMLFRIDDQDPGWKNRWAHRTTAIAGILRRRATFKADLAAASVDYYCNDTRRQLRYSGTEAATATLTDGRVFERKRDVARWAGNTNLGEWSEWQELTPESVAWRAKLREMFDGRH